MITNRKAHGMPLETLDTEEPRADRHFVVPWPFSGRFFR